MTELLFWTAFATALFLLVLAGRLVGERRHRQRLAEEPPAEAGPLVSVIIPVRNEERHLEKALTSVLAQNYSRYEVIAIDDRSSDRSPCILAKLARAHPSLDTLRINTLPAGWLGKNHALWLGVSRARGDLLLFTDADVVMAPSALGRAVALMQRTGIDHLAVGPRVEMPGWILNAFFGAFMIFFTLYARPWKIRDPRSSAHIGIGAFNLLRADVYDAIGGHRAIAMRPDDDMRLGRMVKKGGYRQDLAVGGDLLEVEWYASLKELIGGLEKNTFAGVDYRLSLVFLGGAACLLGFVWPYAGLLLTDGTTRLLNLGNVFLLSWTYVELAGTHGLPRRYAAALPLATLLFVYILWYSAAKIFLRGSMEWRGTRYCLRELKGKNSPSETNRSGRAGR